jgi:hypothetical protein
MTRARDIASTAVLDADLGSTVQAYDADTAKYDDATANFTGTLQGSGSNVVVASDIGSTVQAYITPGTSGNVLTSNGSAWTSAAAAAFDAGTRLMFAQTAAPTGWTKDTVNYNEHSLRVTTGAASTGGTVDFTTAFASKTPTGSVTITSVTGTAGATTLSTPQIPAHNHGPSSLAATDGIQRNTSPQISGGVGNLSTVSLQNTGGGGSHDHPFSFTSGSGTFSGNAIDLAVKYLDVITATKD